MLLAANPASAEASGARVFELVGREIGEATPALMKTEVPSHYAAAIERDEAREWEIRYGDARFPEAVYEARCFRVADRMVGVMFQNITERRRTKEELERTVRELRQANEELERFAYVASHDLKAPLRDITNLSTWLVADLGDRLPAASARHLELLRSRIERMDGLLDALLEYSRASRLEVEVEQFTVADALEACLGLVPAPAGFIVERAGLDVATTSPRTPFELLLRNLLENAFKHHGGAAGTVRVSARLVDRSMLAVTVADDGAGVPEEYRERVFAMFTTLRPRDAVEGAGMGLSLCRRVARQYGGDVTLADSDAGGLAATLTWPAEWGKGVAQ